MKDKKNCCATDLHSLHSYKNPADMMRLHNQLIGIGHLGHSREDNYLRKVRDNLLADDPDGSNLRKM